MHSTSATTANSKHASTLFPCCRSRLYNNAIGAQLNPRSLVLLVFKLWRGAGQGSAQLTTLAATHVACIPHIARDFRNALQLPDTGCAEGLLDTVEVEVAECLVTRITAQCSAYRTCHRTLIAAEPESTICSPEREVLTNRGRHDPV